MKLKSVFTVLLIIAFSTSKVSAQQTQLDPEIRRALEELRVQVENLKRVEVTEKNEEVSIQTPDLDVAELVLQQMMKQSMKYYFQTLMDIKKDITRSIGKITSLQGVATPKSSEIISKVLQDEVNSVIPSLNQNINNRYQLAVNYLVRLFGKADFPVSGYYSGTKNVFKSKSIFHTNYEELLWNICQTKYCHAVISEKIAQWTEFTLAFNTDIDFLNIKNGKNIVVSKNTVRSTPFVYLAMVDAAKETIEEFGLSRNVEYTLPGAMLEFAKDMIGLAKGSVIGLSAIPVGILEESAIGLNKLFVKKIMVPELKLHAINAYESTIVTKSLREFMYEHAKKYENTIFSNEQENGNLEKSNRLVVFNALERARRVTSRPLLGISDELLYEKLEKKYNINYGDLVPYITRARSALSEKLIQASKLAEKSGIIRFEYDSNGMLTPTIPASALPQTLKDVAAERMKRQDRDARVRKNYMILGLGSAVTAAAGGIMSVTSSSVTLKTIGEGMAVFGAAGIWLSLGVASMSSTDTIEEKIKMNPLLFTQVHPDVQDRILKSRPDVVQKINDYVKALNDFSKGVEELKG